MTDDVDRDEGTYTRLDLDAAEAAGDIEIVRPGTPEAAAFDREMVGQLDGYNRDLVTRDGPDALTSDRELRRTAVTLEQHPRYVAHALAVYREHVGLDRAGLARWLGIGADQLAALAIEARPDPASPAFVDVVAALARRYGADPGRLAESLG